MDNFVAHTEDISEFGSRLGVVADTVAQARADAARNNHTGLNAVLGLIAEDFVRVTGDAQRTHVDDLDRLGAVISSVSAATFDAHDLYRGTDETVRRTIAEAART